MIRIPKIGLLPQETAISNAGNGLLARWYERLREIVLKDAEPASRAYRYMARLIEKEFPREANGLCLAFSAPDSDKICTDALLMLAYCLHGELDSRVLIIDARLKDMSEGITSRLGLTEAQGFAEILRDGFEGHESLIRETAVAGVDVLPAGDPGGQGRTALDREKLAQLLDTVRNLYGHVLIQLGSPLRDTRALLTAAETRAVFLLTEENGTLMKTLDDCRRVLISNGVEDVRVVVTGVKL